MLKSSIGGLALMQLAFLWSSLLAQQPSRAEADQSQGAEAPTAEQSPHLAATEVVQRGQAALAELRQIRTALQESTIRVEIEHQLDPVLEAVRGLQRSLTERPPVELGFRQLDDCRRDWIAHDARIGNWLEQLEEHAKLCQMDITRLQEERNAWMHTRESVKQEKTLLPLAERIDGLLVEIDQVLSQVQAELQRLISLQSRVLDGKAAVDDVALRIQDGLHAARGRLLSLDNPPLWRVLTLKREYWLSTAGLTDLWRDHFRKVVDFLKRDQIGLVLHALWFALLALPLLYLRRGRQRWAGAQPSLKRITVILDRPLSAALILSALIARWTYQPMPDPYVRLLLIVMVIPVVRLLARILPSSTHRLLVVLGVLFATHQFAELSVGADFAGRLMILLVSGLTLVALLWLRHVSEEYGASPRPFHRGFLKTLLLSATGMLVLSIVANLVGNVALAEVLSDIVLIGAYLAAMLYAVYVIIEGVLTAILISGSAGRVRSIGMHREGIQRWLLWVSRIALITWWVWVVLHIGHLRDPAVGWVKSLLGAELNIGSVKISLGNVTVGIVALWASVALSRILRVVLEQDVMSRVNLPRGVPATVSMMVRYAVITVGVLFAAAVAGLDLAQFAFVIGALSVGVGFGLQNVVNNFVSGLILAFERPIRVGDTVQTPTLLGEVRLIGIRSSRVRTFDGAEVIVPNGELIAREVTNWTLSDRVRRIVLPVGVAYGSDLRRVQTLLLEVVQRHRKVLAAPEPKALFQGFGESSLDFSLRFWTGDYDNWPTISSEVAIAVNEALKEAGVQIPYPQRDLHIRSMDAAVRGRLD